MEKYPKVRSVEALPGKRLKVVFDNGAARHYDCSPPLELPAFRALKDDVFFRNVRPDVHGHGVIWTDDIDLAESELWLKGKAERAA